MIVGAGDYREYRKLAEALGMGADVLFTGMQQNPFAFLRRADVYALTSQSEGFPNALIEAMACGLPCISANCKTGPAEILQEDYTLCADQNCVHYAKYGILTPVFQGDKDLNPEHVMAEEEIFARELKKMLTDDAYYGHYREMAAERARRFGTQQYLGNLTKLMGKEW
ncbi:MAG: glycosyltransferase, partial [Lachnospiraceae bacterium]|nr:glycosyltransferase [Lachnospiraceae bacterium]